MEKIKVLFLCNQNNFKSQMAEAIMNEYESDLFEAHSAGLEPGKLDKMAVRAMKDIGIDMSQKKPQSVFELHRKGETFSYVITVCSKDTHEKCPPFTGAVKNIHWHFDDPETSYSDPGMRLDYMVDCRNEILKKVNDWVRDMQDGNNFAAIN